MRFSAPPSESPAGESARFVATRWSLVLNAGQSQSPSARGALEELCGAYWQPIYIFVRRQGHSPADAQDLTQAFFARLIEKHYLDTVDPAKGRFRSFLLAALKHFLANEWDKAKAWKRGGRQIIVSMDACLTEAGDAFEPADHASPDKLFERRWALTLLDHVLARLRAEYVNEGKARVFEHLKDTLTGSRQSIGYAQIASHLTTTEGAIKVAAHRLRQRYRALLREEIAQTVSRPEEVEDEIRALFAALAA